MEGVGRFLDYEPFTRSLATLTQEERDIKVERVEALLFWYKDSSESDPYKVNDA